MILFPILLAFFTGLVILRLSNQHKYLNIFEQLALGFVTALSLFIFELFIGGIVFDKLSLVGPIATFIICLGLLIYKNNKHKGFVKEIIQHIKSDFANIKNQFKVLKSWKKYIIIGILIYVLLKIFMVFSINTHMPTFDEDAVGGRDLKTKIFSENKSLVLDKSNYEFLGTSLERNIFAPLTDAYFLLNAIKDVDGLTNIISPILYLLTILLLFGIFLRKTDIFFAAISSYIFCSVPFIFIHGFGSYRNFISGIFLFIFIHYTLDQVLNLENEKFENTKIIIPLFFLSFLTTTIRNESFILVISTIIISSISFYIIKRKYITNINHIYLGLVLSLIGVIIGRFSGKYIISLYPQGVSLNIGGIGTEQGLLESLLLNINQPGLLKAPIQQALYHPDYNILYLLLIIVLLIYIISKISYKHIILYFISFLILLGGTIAILFANLGLGLITHFGFIRFSVVYIVFIIYLLVYMCYILFQKLYYK